MKERPVIFKTEMVKAILDDRKTQTRRVIKKGGVQYCGESGLDRMGVVIDGILSYRMQTEVDGSRKHYEKCPYGKIKDVLWVRETWGVEPGRFIKPNLNTPVGGRFEDEIHYAADDKNLPGMKWHPSIHMFRKDSRINLEITDIRVERVQDISWEDLLAEGYPQPKKGITKESIIYPTTTKMKQWFIDLWNSINAKRGYGWESNPHVWIIEFKKVA